MKERGKNMASRLAKETFAKIGWKPEILKMVQNVNTVELEGFSSIELEYLIWRYIPAKFHMLEV